MKFALLFLALIVGTPVPALALDTSLKEGMILSFKDNKDPGKYILEYNGKSVSVFHHYQTIDPKEIYSVEPGEKFKVVIDEKLGMGLLRLKNNKIHKVWIFNETPIEHRADLCLETAMTTRSISSCYDRAANAWQLEFDFHFCRLIKKMSKTQKVKLKAYREQWEKLIIIKNDLHYERLKTGGTIQLIHIARIIADLKKQMTMTLWVYD